MIESARYVKIVEWSDEDQCYVGSAQGMLLGGCRGPNEWQVFEELCEIVEETIELYHKNEKALPSPTCGHDLANTIEGVA